MRGRLNYCFMYRMPRREGLLFATSAKKRRFSLLFRTYKGRKFAFALEAAPRKIIYHHESLTQFRGGGKSRFILFEWENALRVRLRAFFLFPTHGGVVFSLLRSRRVLYLRRGGGSDNVGRKWARVGGNTTGWEKIIIPLTQRHSHGSTWGKKVKIFFW